MRVVADGGATSSIDGRHTEGSTRSTATTSSSRRGTRSPSARSPVAHTARSPLRSRRTESSTSHDGTVTTLYENIVPDPTYSFRFQNYDIMEVVTMARDAVDRIGSDDIVDCRRGLPRLLLRRGRDARVHAGHQRPAPKSSTGGPGLGNSVVASILRRSRSAKRT